MPDPLSFDRIRLRHLGPSRLAACVACLVAADIVLHPQADDRHMGNEALWVLDVVQRTGRLPGDRRGLSEADEVSANSSAVTMPILLARMLAATAWVRGPANTLVHAALALSHGPVHVLPWENTEPVPGVLWGLWLRELYRQAAALSAWETAVDDLHHLGDRALGRDWENYVSEPEAGVPEAALLGWVRRCVGDGASCESALAQARGSDVPEGVFALTAAVLGLLHGEEAVLETLGVSADVLTPWRECIDGVKSRAVELSRLNRLPPITSTTHPLPVGAIQVRGGKGGVFGLSPQPGENNVYTNAVHGGGAHVRRDLAIDLAQLNAWGATDIICLLPNDLIHDQGLGGMEVETQALGMGFFHYPAPLHSLGMKWSATEWALAVSDVEALVRAGRKPVIHGEMFNDLPAKFAARLLVALRGARDETTARRHVEEAQDYIGAMLAAYPHY